MQSEKTKEQLQAEAMRQALNDQKEGSGKLTRRMVIVIARKFCLEPMDMVKRLEKDGIIKNGSFEWFKQNGGITKNHIEQEKQGKLL